ncbi:MAG TPA: AI-2E family transporter [Flavobacterium sp.]|uniref:AI-2E family transporter n=1 Tax=Flavobacterium sp. TaxID=239 RepID=UPI002CE986E3|nr:AI-2E family transporter [Flavobacterium sp.]HSD15309.1 AI-2E family transporter [Flavobacterium sp.]
MTIDSKSITQKILLFVLVVTGLYFAKDFLMPLLIGGLLATLFLPVCKWIEKKKLSKGLAVFLCLILLLLIITGFISIFSWKISEVITDIDLVKQKIFEAGDYVQENILNRMGITIEDQIVLLKKEQQSLANIIVLIIGSLAYLVTNFVLTLVYFLLLLYYRTHIKNFILQLANPSHQNEIEKVIYSSSHIAQQYLVGLSKMIMCLWVMYGIGFSLLGVKNAIFFAILCGVLEIVPFIGNITGTTLTVLVSALHGASFPLLGGIVLVYGTIQFIQGFFLEPIIVGPQVRINSLFTIIALVLGELLWGIPGVILAIPITAILKIICDHIEPLKPYGFLIGDTEKSRISLITTIKNYLKK